LIDALRSVGQTQQADLIQRQMDSAME